MIHFTIVVDLWARFLSVTAKSILALVSSGERSSISSSSNSSVGRCACLSYVRGSACSQRLYRCGRRLDVLRGGGREGTRLRASPRAQDEAGNPGGRSWDSSGEGDGQHEGDVLLGDDVTVGAGSGVGASGGTVGLRPGRDRPPLPTCLATTCRVLCSVITYFPARYCGIVNLFGRSDRERDEGRRRGAGRRRSDDDNTQGEEAVEVGEGEGVPTGGGMALLSRAGRQVRGGKVANCLGRRYRLASKRLRD